jgi:hypothetical protein
LTNYQIFANIVPEVFKILIISGIKSPVIETDNRTEEIKKLAGYVIKDRLNHKMYGVYFNLCEWVNLVNVACQCILLDKVMNGEFLTFGPEVFMFLFMDIEDRSDPMDQLFPKLVKCSIKEYGKTGKPVVHDGFCLLRCEH